MTQYIQKLIFDSPLRHNSNNETGSLSEHYFQVDLGDISKSKVVKRKSQISPHYENGLPTFSKLDKNEVCRKKYRIRKDQTNKV